MLKEKNSHYRLLFSKIATGDESAFEEIFYDFGEVIYPFVLGLVKQDAAAREIIQETFLIVWMKRDGLTEIENPGAWIYRIASNLALNQFRKKQVEIRVLEMVKQTQQDSADTIAADLDGKELRTLINKAVQQLAPQQKKVFHMIRDEGLSRREVAIKLNISENTVKTHLDKALKSIQAYLGQITGIYIPVILLLHHFPY